MIISTSHLGLCNRIKSIVSCMRWGAHLDEEVRVFWQPLAGTLNCSFSDLFINDLEIKPPFPVSGRFMNAWRLVVLPEDDIPAGFDQITASSPVPFNEGVTDGRHIDFAYHRIPEPLQNIYKELFAQLTVVPSLHDRVEETVRQFDKDTVSVQIRSWPDDPQRCNALFNLNRFVKEIDRLPSHASIFLSADTDDIVNYFSTRYPGRIILSGRSTGRMGSRYIPLGVQDDLVDLLLLARNRWLIGSYISTFTEVAWWLGGCKADVVIV